MLYVNEELVLQSTEGKWRGWRFLLGVSIPVQIRVVLSKQGSNRAKCIFGVVIKVHRTLQMVAGLAVYAVPRCAHRLQEMHFTCCPLGSPSLVHSRSSQSPPTIQYRTMDNLPSCQMVCTADSGESRPHAHLITKTCVFASMSAGLPWNGSIITPGTRVNATVIGPSFPSDDPCG